MPTPVGIEVDLGASLTQLAISKRGAIDPAVYPNLGLPKDFWTPMWVGGWHAFANVTAKGCAPKCVHRLTPAQFFQLSFAPCLLCVPQGPASPVPERQHVHQWRHLPVGGPGRQPHRH